MNDRRVVALALVALLAGCGIPAEESPRTVQPPPGPFQRSAPSEATAPAGPATETLCLVRDNRIIPVPRRADRPATIQDQLRDLFGGPSVEVANGPGLRQCDRRPGPWEPSVAPGDDWAQPRITPP